MTKNLSSVPTPLSVCFLLTLLRTRTGIKCNDNQNLFRVLGGLCLVMGIPIFALITYKENSKQDPRFFLTLIILDCEDYFKNYLKHTHSANIIRPCVEFHQNIVYTLNTILHNTLYNCFIPFWAKVKTLSPSVL